MGQQSLIGSLGSIATVLGNPTAEDILGPSLRTWRIQAGADLDTLFLLASFHSAGRGYAHYWGMRVINSLTQL